MVQNVFTSNDIVFHTSRGFQLPYRRKAKACIFIKIVLSPILFRNIWPLTPISICWALCSSALVLRRTPSTSTQHRPHQHHLRFPIVEVPSAERVVITVIPPYFHVSVRPLATLSRHLVAMHSASPDRSEGLLLQNKGQLVDVLEPEASRSE